MSEWKLLGEEKAKQIWNKLLEKFEDCSPYQSYAWGQYYKALGWEPYYFIAESETGEVTAMLLGLLKRYPFKTGLMWCTGGPVGDIQSWNENLRNTIVRDTKLKRLYMRFRCDRKRAAQDVLCLNFHNWYRTLNTITSNVSMELDLSVDKDTLLDGFSSQWRKNLRLSQRKNLIIKQCLNPDAGEIHKIYAEMEHFKNLPEQFSYEKLKNLFAAAGEDLILYRCEDSEGNLVAVRGCLKIGSRAGDFLAATSTKGRKLCASYATAWQLFEHCLREGIQYYDVGGIDPWANPGVYNFKRGTGAEEVEYLGEWDWANSAWLWWAGNWAISNRDKLKKDRLVAALKSFFKRSRKADLKSLPEQASESSVIWQNLNQASPKTLPKMQGSGSYGE